MIFVGIDLDGTIEDSRADMTGAVHRVRLGLGLPARTDEAVRPWVNKGMDLLYRACFDDYIRLNEARLDEIRKRYESDYLENVAVETRLYPGIGAALERLAEAGRLAVVTNKPERISRRLLEVLGVDKFITAVIGGDTCPQAKPDPTVLKEAARRCGFDGFKRRCFMVGDSTTDLRMGRAFGAATIWCAWGYAKDPGDRPDFVAESPDELPAIVIDGTD
jgi:2-phosphoglycolate phosphatase